MNTFDLYSANLSGTKLIEASAGTGKTFTLAGLYIRYVVEKELLPEQILVLTFTKPATAELKTRLRAQLIECRDHLNGTNLVDEVTQSGLFKLYESYKNTEQAYKQVLLSLLCFDQAAIYTINGFCQKVIDDYNSDCGSPVFQELIVKNDYVKKFVYEFWRKQQKTTPDEFLATIPPIDKVIKNINGLINKSHYRQIKPIIDWNRIDEIKCRNQKLKKLWSESQNTVLDYMFSGSFGRKYSTASYEKCREAMQDFLASYAFPKTNFVERFNLDFLESEGEKPVTLEVPIFIIEFTSFYHTMIYNYSEKKTGNNIAISYLYECFKYVQQQFVDLRVEEGKFDYSDQIGVVHSAIKANQKLVDKIATQWQCVMVDEFQDTDSMQLEIFEKCFNNGQQDLIYVGDPKQAIYDFRGADVFVYNTAKEQIKQEFNLVTNWRSSDKMLAASNAMFDIPDVFKFSWLRFVPSLPKPDQKIQLQDIYPPVVLLDCELTDRNKKLAQEIRRFFVEARLDGESIKPQNCAILVNRNKDAIELYDYLLSRDISVSLWSESGVFSTQVAKQLYYLVRALNYSSKSNIFTSLHGLFFGRSLNQLQAMDIEQLKLEFINYRLAINSHGFVRVVENIFDEKKVYHHLLQRIDGERHYADLIHLVELLQAQVDQGCNHTQLEEWLATQISQAEFMENDEQRKRRIESDGKKISIMTIHKSKGLEFDHVFIPFSEKISSTQSKDPTSIKACLATHDKGNNGVMYWRHSKTAQESQEKEKQAEHMRNLYVAVTRAKHRVYLGLDSTSKQYDKLPITGLLTAIADDSKLCAVATTKEVGECQSHEVNVELSNPKVFNRQLKKPQSIYSFSALSKKQNVTYEVLVEENKEIDHDNYFQFPKGARSGTMQHEVLENLNFNANTEEIQHEVKQQLKRYGFDMKWQDCLSQQIERILNTRLWDQGPKLSRITHSIDEMEFMLPVGSIDTQSIERWLTQHRNKPTHFTQDHLQGFLTGFIDLVFEFENKFYVVDYKSNYLGCDIGNYTDKDLKEAIEHHYYDLQYLLYSVALVKYLKLKISNFDYQTHFGGIAYIFTRGINGQPSQGVYNNLPDQRLIESMLGEFNVN